MDLFHFGTPPLQLAIRCIAIYVALLGMMRIFGKREVGQFTLYDLVLVLLVANAVQPAMTGPDSSLAGGLLIIGVLVLLNFLVARLDRFRLFHHLLAPQPSIIVRNGQYLDAVMRKEGVDRDQCEMAIREHGLDGVAQVDLAVLEADGTISVVPSGSKTVRTRRHVRYIRH